MRLGTKMHKLFNAWCERFGGGKPVTAFRFLFDGQRVDGEQTAEDIDMEDGDQIDALNELLHVTIKFAPSDSPRSLMIPATSTVADLRTALGIGAGPRFVWMGRLLDDDTKSLVEYGVGRDRPARKSGVESSGRSLDSHWRLSRGYRIPLRTPDPRCYWWYSEGTPWHWHQV